MTKKKTKLNYRNIFIAVIIIVLLVIGIIFAISLLTDDNKSTNNTEKIEHKESETMPYSIRSNATDYQKELYSELENIYKDGFSMDLAECIAKNFVADFYTLSNKSIKNDIGGAQFWNEEIRLEFRAKAIEYFYKNLELYIEDYGFENLPTVIAVNIDSSEEKVLGNQTVYHMTVSWSYESTTFPIESLQKSATIEVNIENNNMYMYYLGE